MQLINECHPEFSIWVICSLKSHASHRHIKYLALQPRSYDDNDQLTTTMMMISTLRIQFLLLVGSLWLAASAGSNQEGEEFLAVNKGKEGVVSLPSGMQYKVLKKGSGIYHPGPVTPCSVHYTGSLIDGTVFDSSVERGQPATFAPNQVVAGWTEAYVWL
jgi:FKBP-type peptidyl-prolyl cis-trans isomerase FklB